jgi:acetyltransferase-like isoleucine patch superfamily enzyme
VTIERGAWIMPGVIITPGVTIGERAVIGTGAVVTKDIPPEVVAIGVPAKVIKQVES